MTLVLMWASYLMCLLLSGAVAFSWTEYPDEKLQILAWMWFAIATTLLGIWLLTQETNRVE
jgi:hypothetical protein